MSVDSLIGRFNTQVAATPNSVAVSFEQTLLSYRELDDISNRFAGYLHDLGVISGDRVGLCVERGLMLPVALLGVLKLGACYVPLDAGFPETRLRMMAKDSDVKLILSSVAYAYLFEGFNTQVVEDSFLDENHNYSSRMSKAPAAIVPTGPETTVYLIYTSGSTGRPKGIVMPQRALLNLIDWQSQQAGLDKPLRTLQFAPVSFDVHFQEFLGTWCQGGELVLIRDTVRRDAIALSRFLLANKIERLFLPFVALQSLAEISLSFGCLPMHLKEIVTAGEQLQVNRHISAFFQQLPECRLHNHYGPSESHVVTAYTLSGDAANWELLPPIGEAINNVRIYIVDESLKPLERGQEGEICIAGLCLSDGYWRQPEMTQDRFIEHLIGDDQRIYRTGDLGKFRDDGNVEYLGRIDGQVKVSGYRVETAEIETAICEQPFVKSCAVIAAGNTATEKKLNAYIVLDTQHSTAEAQLLELQVAQRSEWQQVWDGTYSQETVSNPEFDISGWNNSYTGEPISEQNMQLWVEGTISTICALQPRRVLEIGCGTGLIMYGVAPSCEYYHATDFSPIAINALERHLDNEPARWPHCKASVMLAEQLETLKDENFDVIVMNSVTQHFISLNYLKKVLEQAVGVLKDGGTVFVGDVTNLHFREAFFADLEMGKSAAETQCEIVRANIEKRLGEERELVIAPEWFYLLSEAIPRVSSVEVRLKPRRSDSELTLYRYDVTLRVASAKPVTVEQDVDWLDAGQCLNNHMVGFFEEHLLVKFPDLTGIKNVHNSRVAKIFRQLKLLQSGSNITLSNLKQELMAVDNEGVDPQDFKDLENTLPYRIDVVFSSKKNCFDVVASRIVGDIIPPPYVQFPTSNFSEGAYATAPLNTKIMLDVVSNLRTQLAEKLPDYMMPHRYQQLSRLPMTPSGKLDRRALPAIGYERPELEQEFVAAKTNSELSLAKIWREALEIDRIGVNDNFFDLGGNSILSVKIAVKIKQQNNSELSLVTLFQYPTVRSLASYLESSKGAEKGDSIKSAARDRAKKQQKFFARNKRVSR